MKTLNSKKISNNGPVHFATLSVVIFIAVITWMALSWTEDNIKRDLVRSLESTLYSAQNNLRTLYWIQQAPTLMWANDERVKNAARALSLLPNDPQILLAAPELKYLRDFFSPLMGQFGFRGFFIISNDNVSLASARDENLGTINLLSQQPKFLEKVRAGGTLVSSPMKSDVPLEDNQGRMIDGLSTMFAAAPIHNENGMVLAVLAIRIDPDANFRGIIEKGRFGDSAETYAFDKNGVLLSDSRFVDHLRSIGLLTTEYHADLSVQIRDPGVNLVEGQIPQRPRKEQPFTRMALSGTRGESGLDIDGYRDYRGVPVVGAWLWDKQLGFGIATELDFDEAYAGLQRVRTVVIGLTSLLIMGVGLLWFVFIRSRDQIAKSAEVAIKAFREAEESNKAKSQFLSAMSHELRSPLTAILGFSELMELSDPPQSKENMESIAHIKKGAEHLSVLINEVLDLSKIEAGKLDLSIQDAPLKDILEECLFMAKPLAEKYGVTLEDRTNEQLPNVRADVFRLKQSILNLLSNGSKYNNPGGKVWITSEVIGRDRLKICVSDNGIGIPLSRFKDIGQPFSRVGSDSAKVEGTGIGLVISKRIIEEMGGNVGFTSSYGEGSTFWIEIPLATKQESLDGKKEQLHPDSSSRSTPTSSSNAVVFYIEDNPASLKLMERVVEKIPGLELRSAPTAEVGLQLIETSFPNVVILDINLPGMNGNEAAEILRQHLPTKNIPLIALSANAMESDIKKGLEAGFDEYLVKPINIKNLISILSRYVEQVKAKDI